MSFNSLLQIGLVVFTAAGYALTSLKKPEYGLLAAGVAQIFWLYSSYRSWKEADQIGIFIATILITVIVFGGVLNYWFLK